MARNGSPLTIAQKIAAGGFLSLRHEFCPWAGICAVTAYKEARTGRLRLTKIGRKTVVAAPDAIAFRDELRSAAV
jgi:hypothetical protein